MKNYMNFICVRVCTVLWCVGASSGSYSEHLLHFNFSLRSKVVKCSYKKSIALNALQLRSARASAPRCILNGGKVGIVLLKFSFSNKKYFDFIFTQKYETQTSLECGEVPLDTEIRIRNPSIQFPYFQMEFFSAQQYTNHRRCVEHTSIFQPSGSIYRNRII